MTERRLHLYGFLEHSGDRLGDPDWQLGRPGRSAARKPFRQAAREPVRPAAGESGTLDQQWSAGGVSLYLAARRDSTTRDEWDDSRRLVTPHAMTGEGIR